MVESPDVEVVRGIIVLFIMVLGLVIYLIYKKTKGD